MNSVPGAKLYTVEVFVYEQPDSLDDFRNNPVFTVLGMCVLFVMIQAVYDIPLFLFFMITYLAHSISAEGSSRRVMYKR
jgi:hypothetical protein